jgi:hypothetical protein
MTKVAMKSKRRWIGFMILHSCDSETGSYSRTEEKNEFVRVNNIVCRDESAEFVEELVKDDQIQESMSNIPIAYRHNMVFSKKWRINYLKFTQTISVRLD